MLLIFNVKKYLQICKYPYTLSPNEIPYG